MSLNRKLFCIVVWLGVIANFTFAIWAVWFNPHSLLGYFRLGDLEPTIWLYNYSILLMILSLFYIPAAHDPFRYRANAWLLIVGRLVPASTFFIGSMIHFMPPGFVTLGIGDSTFGVLELILLLRVFREQEPAPAWKGRA